MLAGSALIGFTVLESILPATNAGFSTTDDVGISLAAGIDVGQGSEASGAHATPETAKLLVSPGETLPVTRIEPGAVGLPLRQTATVHLQLQNRSAVSPIAGFLSVQYLGDPTSAGPLAESLRIAVFANGEAATGPDPLPLEAVNALNEQRGVSIGDRIEPGDSAAVVLRVWLAEHAPPGDLGQPVHLGARVVGETVAGERFDVAAVFP